MGRNGLRGTLAEAPSRRGGKADETVVIVLEDGRHLRVPASLLVAKGDGAYEVPLSAEDLGGFGADGESVVVPVVAEEARVGKRVVEGGRVRVKKTVGTREKVIEQPLVSEEVVVERREVNREVDGPVPVRQTRGAIIVPLLQEVLVVQKRLVLREELVITKRRVVRNSRQVVELRHDEVRVERETGDERPGEVSEGAKGPGERGDRKKEKRERAG